MMTWLIDLLGMQASAPEGVREQVLRLLAVLLKLPHSIGLIPPFSARVGACHCDVALPNVAWNYCSRREKIVTRASIVRCIADGMHHLGITESKSSVQVMFLMGYPHSIITVKSWVPDAHNAACCSIMAPYIWEHCDSMPAVHSHT